MCFKVGKSSNVFVFQNVHGEYLKGIVVSMMGILTYKFFFVNFPLGTI